MIKGVEYAGTEFGRESNLDLSIAGSSVKFQIEHPYRGKYALSMIVDGLTMDPVKTYGYDAILKVKIYTDTKIYLEKTVANKVSPFWGTEGESGFTILRYRCPDECPLDKPVTVEVTVEKPSASFYKRYPLKAVTITKGSDL